MGEIIRPARKQEYQGHVHLMDMTFYIIQMKSLNAKTVVSIFTNLRYLLKNQGNYKKIRGICLP